ncbi:MAG: hypothetical protein M3P89_00410 [Actinomycetota bacterium]|nr:hypothetical protein [Actinomycetota bacterium]
MRSRAAALLLALGLAIALLPACSADDADRRPGDAVTAAEAQTLARLLHLNLQRGGADFVVTAPYDGAVLTVTGEVNFRRTVGRAQAVTTFGDGRPDDVRTVFFTDEHIWFGNVPGLAESLAVAGAPGAAYLRRPVPSPGESPVLVDFVLGILLNLSAPRDDDPEAFRHGGYTWEGQRSIDSRLTSLYGLPSGRAVAVGSGGLLTQFVTPLPGGDSEVTVTLSDHGRRRLGVPAEQKTADVADHADLAAAFGL